MSGGYEAAGVRGQGEALSAVERLLGPTFSFPDDVEVLTPFGAYAGVLRLSDDLALAICTDGVGSKTIVASMLDRYDTIGFDCMAMNVNDLICAGARPIAMVDYLGVHTLDAGRTRQILEGLAAAAEEAGVAIPGGETAQLPEVIGSDGEVPGDERAFDLVGTAIGLVHPDRVITGDRVTPGDVLIGLAASGIHSNGLSLARRALLKDAGYTLDEQIPRLGRTLGEELLEPTRIYVRALRALWDAGIDTPGLIHVTGDGLANLCRLAADVGYAITSLPDPPPIFDLIADAGGVDPAEMYRVFNMGVGLVVVVPPRSAGTVLDVLGAAGYPAQRIGVVSDGAREVVLEPAGLIGGMDRGDGYFRAM